MRHPRFTFYALNQLLRLRRIGSGVRAFLKLSDGLNEVASADQVRSQAAIQQQKQSYDESDYYEVLQDYLID